MGAKKLFNIPQKKNMKKKLLIVFASVMGSILVLAGILLFTPLGKNILTRLITSHVYNKINYTQTPADPEENTPKPSKEFIYGKDIVNILLIGEEAIESNGAKGNTDTLIIATLNAKQKKIKLTSIMRDTWITIPGYLDNRINYPYSKGGIPLLYQCIENNFNLKLDGHVLVGFKDFENVINALGGVEITLTDEEAEYLNTTNYISKKKYRTVVPGTQILNGNQALGYSRIRRRPTIDGLHDDFGRIARQKTVINSAFQKLKELSLPQLVKVMDQLIPLVHTDIPANSFNAMLSMAIDIRPTGFDSLQIPAAGTFKFETIREKDVIVADIPANTALLHSFIFDEEISSPVEGTTDATGSGNTYVPDNTAVSASPQ